MTGRADLDYFRSRERQERAMAEAADAGAAAIHLEMASRYAKLTTGTADLVSRDHQHRRTDLAALEPGPHDA